MLTLPCLPILSQPPSARTPCYRGGPGASTHVEILGHDGVLMDVMRLAAGNGSALRDLVITDVEGIASRIPWHEL